MIKFEFDSAVGELFNGDVLTLIFIVVVILVLNESALGGLPLFLFIGGEVLLKLKDVVFFEFDDIFKCSLDGFMIMFDMWNKSNRDK